MATTLGQCGRRPFANQRKQRLRSPSAFAELLRAAMTAPSSARPPEIPTSRRSCSSPPRAVEWLPPPRQISNTGSSRSDPASSVTTSTSSARSATPKSPTSWVAPPLWSSPSTFPAIPHGSAIAIQESRSQARPRFDSHPTRAAGAFLTEHIFFFFRDPSWEGVTGETVQPSTASTVVRLAMSRIEEMTTGSISS